MMAKRRTNRTRVSSFYKKDYDYTMDELDLFIEDFMLATRKTLTGKDAALLMNSVLASYNISKKRKLTIEMNYYSELLSRLVKTYGH
jgi:hypothetical protein